MILAEAISRWFFFTNAILTFISEYFNLFDDSIEVLTGILAITGGIMWISILRLKKKRERIETEIKEIELKRLKDIES